MTQLNYKGRTFDITTQPMPPGWIWMVRIDDRALHCDRPWNDERVACAHALQVAQRIVDRSIARDATRQARTLAEARQAQDALGSALEGGADGVPSHEAFARWRHALKRLNKQA